MSRSGLLCVFAKAPLPGMVKTRLIPAIGAERAARLAEAGLRDTWTLATRNGQARLLLDGDAATLPTLTPHPQILRQSTGDLGARLSACFRELLEQAPWVIAVGTDSPGLPQAALHAAMAWLGGGGSAPRAVLGPSRDGGYYLLGLSAWQKTLLDDLPWSQATTLSATRARLLARGFAVSETEPYFDVDDADDLRHLLSVAQHPGFEAPATRALLRAWERG